MPMVADGRGVGGKNREKFADVFNGWFHTSSLCTMQLFKGKGWGLARHLLLTNRKFCKKFITKWFIKLFNWQIEIGYYYEGCAIFFNISSHCVIESLQDWSFRFDIWRMWNLFWNLLLILSEKMTKNSTYLLKTITY